MQHATTKFLLLELHVEIGVALTTFGALFMFLGVILFFDGALLALGNVCVYKAYRLMNAQLSSIQVLFLSGITLIIGPQKTFYFFARKNKLRGTLCFLGGILLVFFKWPFVGFVVEIFGFLNLFGYALPEARISTLLQLKRLTSDFFPVILTFLRQLPFIGNALTLPYIRDVGSQSSISTILANLVCVTQVADRLAGSRTSAV